MADSPAPRALYLLDGMQLAYRAYFALIRNPIRTSAGLNTSALFGFANLLEDIRHRRGASHLAVVWDTAAPTFRHQRFADYKATRDEMPDDLSQAIPAIKAWVEALDLPTLESDGWEADDIIATLAAQAEADGCEMTWMVTADKDFGQLVTDHVHILRPGRQGSVEEEWGPATVCERWGIQRPAQVIDMLALMGDASDNIPGVPGIGEKTAAKLLAEHASVDGVLAAAAAGKIKGKNGERLVEFADQARLSHELATIIPTAPVSLDWAKLSVGEPDHEALAQLCIQFEFNSLGKRILGENFHAGRSAGRVGAGNPAAGAVESKAAAEGAAGKKTANPDDLFASPSSAAEAKSGADFAADSAAAPAASAVPADAQAEALGGPHALPEAELRRLDLGAVDYQALTEPVGIQAFLGSVNRSPELAFDTETDGLDPRRARLLGASFAIAAGTARFVIVPAADGPARDEILGILRDFFGQFSGELLCHNAKYDLAVLLAHGIAVSARVFDTMLASGLLDISQRRSLDFLAETRLGYRPIAYAELTGSAKPAEQTALAELLESDAPAVTRYACEDADITFQLAQILRPELAQTGQLASLLEQVEGPLTPVLIAMEAEGIRLDPAALDEVRAELSRRIGELESSIRATAGTEINLASPKQLGELLFERLRLAEKPKRTKTGQYVTNEQVLSQLAQRHEIVAQILSWREATKLRNTYVDPLPASIDARDGRIHTSYQQLAATTGRLASTDPNLQNIPVRSDLGRLVRQAFVPRGPGFTLLSCDYSQVELRIMAHLSGDEALQAAFRSGEDIHRATAARVFHVPVDEVLPEMRRAAKMVNFGIIYGISAFGLSQRLGCSRAEATSLIAGYWASYPKVRDFMAEVVETARARGYGETLLGRRCPMPDLVSRNAAVRGNAERFAINMPIQGSAADLIKKAMVEIHQLLNARPFQTRLVLQVHDELVFDLAESEAEELIPRLIHTMETALPLAIPLQVDHGTGVNWLAAH